MAAPWVLVGWAQQFRSEINQLAPGRDKASDGTIGDAAHKLSPSGHNPDDTPGSNAERNDGDGIPEVRAIDIDKDLRVPGLTMAKIVAYLVGRCRAGLERRFIYIIYNRTIWSASSGWQARAYTGSNPHTSHGHFSGDPRYDDDRRPFGLASLLDGSGGPSAPTTGGITDMLGMKKGDNGPQVRLLQILLYQAGFNPGAQDGKYGDQTAAALLAARKSLGSKATSGDEVTPDALEQVLRVHAMRWAKTQPGPRGPEGPPGKVDVTAVAEAVVQLIRQATGGAIPAA